MKLDWFWMFFALGVFSLEVFLLVRDENPMDLIFMVVWLAIAGWACLRIMATRWERQQEQRKDWE